MKSARLWLELSAIYGGFPLLIALMRERWLFIAILWGAAIICYYILHKQPDKRHAMEWNWQGLQQGWRPVIFRFLAFVPALGLFTLWHDPERFLSFPLERPVVWLLVILLYPLLSVWPQELLFRSYMFHRYRLIMPEARYYQLASALLFGYAHIIFMNWIAIGFCLLGGWMFAGTYLRHRSLALVCLEHALYGCLVFTLGLGWYFYGTAWQPLDN